MTKQFSRRKFLQAATVACAAPQIVADSVRGAAAPSNRIQVGFIGTGNQCMGVLLQQFLERPDVQAVAVCDVNQGSYGYKNDDDFYGREPARQRIDQYYAEQRRSGSYRDCVALRDFRELLDRPDIDAVVIAVPDHWHAAMTVLACEAGKDVYCEKPLSLTVADGRAMIEAVRRHQRILQTGSHERSRPESRHACELVRNGRIGKLQRIITNVGYHNKVGPGPGWQAMPVPPDFDYAMWLGPAADAPYHRDRCLYRFRFIYDYSGGQITNYGAHSNDLAQWALDADGTGPVEVQFIRAKWLPNGSLFDAALETEFRCRYANGVELVCRTDEPSVQTRFEGTEGVIVTGYGGHYSEPASIWKSEIGADELHLPYSSNHIGNFIDCVKSRQEPIAPVEAGHSSATLCHLGVIACRLSKQKVLRWDPQSERFTNDDDANALLRRPQKPPWNLA